MMWSYGTVEGNGYIELDRCVLQTIKGGHYVINRQPHAFLCNNGMIVLVTAKIACYSYNYSLIALKCVLLPICIIFREC